MRYAGLDVGSEVHVVAVVSNTGEELVGPTRCAEDADGYAVLRAALGDPGDICVVMEATGHYWRNVTAFLGSQGYAVGVVNPMRTAAFAHEELRRTKTDAADARALAQFARQKHFIPTPPPEPAQRALKELVMFRCQLRQQEGEALNRVHRLVDLTFPELSQLVPGIAAVGTLALLERYPTAQAVAQAPRAKVARLLTSRGRARATELARAVCAAAKRSVGAQQDNVIELEVRTEVEHIHTLRRRLEDVDKMLKARLDDDERSGWLRSIQGLGDTSIAHVLADLGDKKFSSVKALSAYVGVVPGLRHSGQYRPSRAALHPVGNANLRRALYMPTIQATRYNPVIRATWRRLKARGKPGKVALIACMHQLLRIIYAVLRDRHPFIVPAAVG